MRERQSSRDHPVLLLFRPDSKAPSTSMKYTVIEKPGAVLARVVSPPVCRKLADGRISPLPDRRPGRSPRCPDTSIDFPGPQWKSGRPFSTALSPNVDDRPAHRSGHSARPGEHSDVSSHVRDTAGECPASKAESAPRPATTRVRGNHRKHEMRARRNRESRSMKGTSEPAHHFCRVRLRQRLPITSTPGMARTHQRDSSYAAGFF